MDVVTWNEEPVEQLNPAIRRQLFNTERMTIARIQLEAGAVVPEHSHEHEQVVNVLEGRMRFRIDGEELTVGPGESLLIESNASHDATALENSIVLDVFAPPRDDWQRGDDAYLRG
jgi:quercetin dioxygenase-like cupin family protein